MSRRQQFAARLLFSNEALRPLKADLFEAATRIVTFLLYQSINQSINIRLLRHDKMQANKQKNKRDKKKNRR